MTLVTYGGGTILRDVFNSIAMFLNGDGGLLNPLMIISLSCGGLWTVATVFFSGKIENLLLRFFLPVVAITSLIALPTTTIHIEDVLTGKSEKVDNVPAVLVHTTEIISSLGYAITTGIESVMHHPNDANYNSTGMVFGSETSLDISRYKISNAVLEQNLKRFSKQCVFYDLALNRYTLNELKKTNDLWSFLEKRSSKVRMIPYTNPTDPKAKPIYLTCQKAMEAMSPIFKGEVEYYGKQDIVKNLPLTFQALTGLQKNQQELISQQLMMNLLSGELTGDQYAKTRAQAQQRNTYHVLGALASSSLVTMRAVFEAIIYASVIFIIPLSVLPGGLSFISNWLWMTVWIQLWPPFYAIINYIMQSAAQGKSSFIFQGLTDQENGLSFFTSIGLSNLNDDIFALSGYLAASIPFISYAILKGGVSSFIHLAGSLMTPAHAAATTTAGEQATGNFSLSNVNYGQTSFGNTTGFQRNLAPSISEGFFSENSGNMRTTYAGNEAIIDQGASKFRMAISSDEALINSCQKSLQSAEMISESQQKSYMESIAASGRNMTDLTTHLSQSQNYSEGISSRDAYDVQESARYLESQASSLSEQYGISSRDSMSILMSARQLTTGLRTIPLVGSIVDAVCTAIPEYHRGTSKEEIANSSLNIVNSEDFQKSYQHVADFVTSQSHSNVSDEGLRYVEAASRSLDEVASSQEQYQFAKSRSDQASDMASWAQQHTQIIRKSLDQDLFNWASENYGFGEAKRILTSGTEEEAATLVQSFIGTLKHEYDDRGLQVQFDHQTQRYDEGVPTINKTTALEEIHRDSDKHLFASSYVKEDFSEKSKALATHFDHIQQTVEKKVGSANQTIAANQQQMSDTLQDQHKDLAVSRLYTGAFRNLTGQQSRNTPPLGWKKD